MSFICFPTNACLYTIWSIGKHFWNLWKIVLFISLHLPKVFTKFGIGVCVLNAHVIRILFRRIEFDEWKFETKWFCDSNEKAFISIYCFHTVMNDVFMWMAKLACMSFSTISSIYYVEYRAQSFIYILIVCTYVLSTPDQCDTFIFCSPIKRCTIASVANDFETLKLWLFTQLVCFNWSS